jgi:hypothetical protein
MLEGWRRGERSDICDDAGELYIDLKGMKPK